MLCTCKEPALQLLSRGLFPCAPLQPSLAIDLNVLDFARELFVHAAPNTTAWCDTLEAFLSAREFKLTTRVSAEVFASKQNNDL
jgi:CxC1 like cysteine cluster associated with KDZ transposases